MLQGDTTDYGHATIIGVLSKAYTYIFIELKGIVHIVHVYLIYMNFSV